MHVQEAKSRLGTAIPWIADSMENVVKHAMGDRPNSEFVIDPQGKIVRLRDWSNPASLRKDLVALVGPVDNPTDPSRIRLRTEYRKTEVATNVVERVQPDASMRPVRVKTTQPEKHPAYIKLRAEGDTGFVRNGSGRVYLGLFVDPIHHVHWNNRSGPIAVEVATLGGRPVIERPLVGPEVKPDADADPREFMIDVEVPRGESLVVTLRYVACDDKETWCRKLKQQFVVSRETDADAGRVMRRGGGNRRMRSRDN